MGLLKYFKTAFRQRWNLLALGAAAGFAAIGFPQYADVWLPLLLAGEATYLGLLGTHPKFQKYVDARDANAVKSVHSESAEDGLRRILAALPAESAERFETLRAQCLELRQIASQLRPSGPAGPGMPLEEHQSESLDRLLWIYVRLLYTQHTLSRFLQRPSSRDLEREIRGLEDQLSRFKEGGTSSREKIKRTLEDNLQTCRDRLANVQKARDSHELMGLEISRLENKIRALAELAVNRQEPDYISGQIDQVASSMVETEQTMNELRFATGLEAMDEAVPQLTRPRVLEEN